MPTYQYACTACDHRFDAVQSFSDASLTECPECGGKLRKLYGSVGVVFKGSGFYRNDSRSESKSKATAPAATSSTDKAASSTASSSEKSSSTAEKSSSSSEKSSSSSTSSTDKVAS
ncbi:FmdB family zinc ribbon protein [Actinophytocola oryzae]|uniref:Putative FmdB family regulatory protein n=1 Tax=Actinophytocola oryzae TaxID=502181 RepID=A0A4R7V906_9PSEU|nr:FmdB family zinc ribbon protein [Actinophytocola oryzae]TDV45387.1 putative FmdB family regulatory protein [Actinophytocola oryzae]